jgi:hypothetical protein
LTAEAADDDGEPRILSALIVMLMRTRRQGSGSESRTLLGASIRTVTAMNAHRLRTRDLAMVVRPGIRSGNLSSAQLTNWR